MMIVIHDDIHDDGLEEDYDDNTDDDYALMVMILHFD
jgi:hypothetical protein